MKMNRKPDEEQDEEGRARGRKTQNRKNVTKIGKRKEARKTRQETFNKEYGRPSVTEER